MIFRTPRPFLDMAEISFSAFSIINTLYSMFTIIVIFKNLHAYKYTDPENSPKPRIWKEVDPRISGSLFQTINHYQASKIHHYYKKKRNEFEGWGWLFYRIYLTLKFDRQICSLKWKFCSSK